MVCPLRVGQQRRASGAVPRVELEMPWFVLVTPPPAVLSCRTFDPARGRQRLDVDRDAFHVHRLVGREGVLAGQLPGAEPLDVVVELGLLLARTAFAVLQA